MDLSKHDKKIARRLIDKGLQQEFCNGMTRFKAILQEWSPELEDHKTPYHTLFKAVADFDKHIARRYDRLTGSLYFLTVIAQWKDGLHTEADLAEFSPEVREMIERMRMP